MAQTAKIIDFQEQRKRRELSVGQTQPAMPVFPVGMAWVPVFMMPVVVFAQQPFNA